MSFKIPCGGFKLDEESFSLDKNDVLSIPKPLSYDYMPEGYPSKSDTVTLMEEQEVAFSEYSGKMQSISPIILETQSGDKLTVAWDGINYEVVVTTLVEGVIAFGNTAVIGVGETTDYPFCYIHQLGREPGWVTTDTSPSHTIGVTRQQVTYTPMDANFIPNTIQRVGDDVIVSSSTPDSSKKFKITVDDSGTISATEVT